MSKHFNDLSVNSETMLGSCIELQMSAGECHGKHRIVTVNFRDCYLKLRVSNCWLLFLF